MRDYVVQAGPLRTFEQLYDSRFEKIRAVGEFHTIQLVARPGTQRRFMADMKRPLEREIQFVAAFFLEIAKGHRTVFGIRDVTQGKAYALGIRLKDQGKLKWFEDEYGVSEDDLVVAELQDFAGDFQILKGCVPPSAGEMFFYLTAAPFDVYEIHWRRAAKASLKAQEDRFRKDVVGLASQSKIVLYQDPDGSYTVVVHPQVADISAIENQIAAAGEKAGMSITFAPGLFS